MVAAYKGFGDRYVYIPPSLRQYMDEHTHTPDEDDWSDARYEAEVAVRIARETYMFDACPETCDELQEAYHDAQKALAAVIRKEATV